MPEIYEKCEVVERESQVRRATNYLEKTLALLAEASHDLDSRLTDILRPDACLPYLDEEDESLSVPLALEMRDLNDRATHTLFRLRALIDRIEL